MLECRCLLSISTVVGRELFYDQSSYDGGAGIDSLDGSAIATDKSAYLPGNGLAASANLSTYTRGINGIMIDLLGGGSHASINANDFVFKTGNNNTVAGWSTAPGPSAITVVPGAGVSGSDRVEIVWGANAVKHAWLEVQVLATPNTGLAATDAFFWANLLGDSNLNYSTSGVDSSSVLASIGTPAPISSTRDHNRSQAISGTDSSAVLFNIGSLTKINISSAGPLLSAALAYDSGPGGVPNNDGITIDPTITGTLSAVNSVASFKAGINAGPINNNVTFSGGNFTLNTAFLQAMNGGSLPDGSYVVHLLAVDALGKTATQAVSFALDVEHGAPAINAALVNDTGTSNQDGVTSDPAIAGNLSANAAIVSFRASLNPGSAPPITDPIPGQTVTFDWALVGNPGNAGELSGAHAPSLSGGGVDAVVGAVDHSYLISKYGVTNSQYVEFLNAKDPTGANSLSLYSSAMTYDTANGGIGFDANQPNGSKYSVILGHGDYPVVYVSWFDAIRFANWLNNGQGNGDTETGAYTIAGGGLHGENITRNPTATLFLPSEDEWYKAAYWKSADGTYWHYATQSNDVPDYQVPPGGNNSANYVPGGWPNPNYELAIGHLTPVGAFATSVGPYGTFDQAGNALQWTETLINTPNGITRSLRGGSYQYVWDHMSAAYRDSATPDGENNAVGFRVASVASVDVLPLVQGDGSFLLSPTFLDNLNGAPLADGSYVVHLQAFDSYNLVGTVDVPFTLNRSAPAALPAVTESSGAQLATAAAADFNAVASTLAAPPLANATTSLEAQPAARSIGAVANNGNAQGASSLDLTRLDEGLSLRRHRSTSDAEAIDFVLGTLDDEPLR